MHESQATCCVRTLAAAAPPTTNTNNNDDDDDNNNNNDKPSNSTVRACSSCASSLLWCVVVFAGIISNKTLPGGGTTDYAVDIFYSAVKDGAYDCFLRQDTVLPMMYMPDAVKAAVDLLGADQDRLSQCTYNVASVSFTPAELAVRACVRACVRAFVRACVRACVCVRC